MTWGGQNIARFSFFPQRAPNPKETHFELAQKHVMFKAQGRMEVGLCKGNCARYLQPIRNASGVILICKLGKQWLRHPRAWGPCLFLSIGMSSGKQPGPGWSGCHSACGLATSPNKHHHALPWAEIYKVPNGLHSI